mgnify:CR=1 FL=1|jgi:hypothetical protein
MDRYVVILFWALILAVVLLSTPTKFMEDKKEGFYTYTGYYKNYCPSTGWRSRYSCGKCTNAGYCITASGNGECVPGDSSGPYFRNDCMYWEYSNPYQYYPYSHLYPTVKTRSIYPYHKWGRKGRHQKP